MHEEDVAWLGRRYDEIDGHVGSGAQAILDQRGAPRRLEDAHRHRHVATGDAAIVGQSARAVALEARVR